MMFLKRLPRALLFALAFTFVTLLGGAIPDALGYAQKIFSLPEQSIPIIQFIVTVLGICLATWLSIAGFQKTSDVRPYPAGEANDKNAREGLIILISKSKDATDEAIRKGYSDAFAGKNPFTWGAPVKAILAHQSRLKFIWCISSTDSKIAAEILKGLIEEKLSGIRVNIDYVVQADAMSDLAIQETQGYVKKIFEENQQIPPRMLVADITGGTKPMTLGVAFACLDDSRDIQYTASRFEDDVAGQKTETTKVQMFGFETRVKA